MTTLEFRIAISPNRSMYSNVRLAALSLARLGAPYSTARIRVSVGDCADHEQVVADNAWARDFPVEWHVAQHHDCIAAPPMASGADRYLENPQADIVILCDADLCIVGRFGALVSALSAERPTIAGLQAHFSPFAQRNPEANDAMWAHLLAAAGLAGRTLDYGYSMIPERRQGKAPAYFNYGFVAFNRPAFLKIAPIVTRYSRIAGEVLSATSAGNPLFQAQIGLSMAILATGVDVVQTGHALNCANDDRVFKHGLTDISEVRAIHYLRTEEFDRADFVCDDEAFRRFVSKPLNCRISERLREHILALPDPVMR